jgi:hypothetical protein
VVHKKCLDPDPESGSETLSFSMLSIIPHMPHCGNLSTCLGKNERLKVLRKSSKIYAGRWVFRRSKKGVRPLIRYSEEYPSL